MSVQVLIDSIVLQVTVLIAQLATSGGIGDEVCEGIVHETLRFDLDPLKRYLLRAGLRLGDGVSEDADCAAVPVAAPCVGGCDAVVASSAAAALAAEVERIGLAICEKSCDPALVGCPPASVRCQQGRCTGE